MGGLLGSCILGDWCASFGGLPDEDIRFPVGLMESTLKRELLSLQLIIGIEFDDDRMMVNTRRSFVCRNRCRTSVRWPNASSVSLSLLS